MEPVTQNLIPDLPILDFRDATLDSIDSNQVTIITAETGAGKSTQVPQYLAEHGYTKVIVTQPRILAARNLSNRVREEFAVRTLTDSDRIVGYRTAHERDDYPETKILYCTDGLQLVREISGEGIGSRQVLILDEVHEWNENMEVLIAWAKKRCDEEPGFKVVIMSATIDTSPLAEFFSTTAVINVPGRSHTVEKRHGSDVVSELRTIMDGPSKNVLVFLPGKLEIQDVTNTLSKKALASGIPIIPLHSQLDAGVQQSAFASYPQGKIILSTNIAQTSVTIDDIDIVIDSGLERRSEVRSGVEGLFIAQISQADCLQRAGRAGRTKPGTYILAQYDALPCAPLEDRPPYGTPEILRKHIDRLTLRLANVGMDIETLDFYHDPSISAIKRAKRTLRALGAMTPSGEVTDIGHTMERYPVESSYARMLVESEAYSAEVKSKLAVIIAIQEVGGIVKGGAKHTGWQRFTKQKNSDLLAQYDVFISLEQILPDEYEEIGIIGKNVAKAKEVMQRLGRDLQGVSIDENSLTPISASEETELMRCIVAGLIDELWSIDEHGNATHILTNKVRELSSSSVVRAASLVAGTPFDLEIPNRDGSLQTLRLVQDITRVDTKWLVDFAPDDFVARGGKMVFDPRSGMLVERMQVRFGKQVLEGTGTPVTENTKQNQKSFQTALAKWAYEQIERERRSLVSPQTKRVREIPLTHVLSVVQSRASGIVRLEDVPKARRMQIMNLAKLSTYIGEELVNHLKNSKNRSRSVGRHHAHRGWKPAHKRGSKQYRRGRDQSE